VSRQSSRLRIGAHVDSVNPLAEAEARGADLAQFFLSDPQGWRKPVPREDAAELRATDIAIYIHAPYLVNVASANNRIRIPSRKILDQHATAAADIGAKGLIVHGGHLTAEEDAAEGILNWRKTVQRMVAAVPILVENTAGGENALARRLDGLARLWDAIGSDSRIGFCLDTCHAHAAGEDLDSLVERVLAITGRIDLVHANDSKDAFGSNRDRHQNLGAGRIEPGALVSVVAAAGAPVVCETPGGAAGQAADITMLRDAGL
jgi:deoxyribonuclease IV